MSVAKTAPFDRRRPVEASAGKCEGIPGFCAACRGSTFSLRPSSDPSTRRSRGFLEPVLAMLSNQASYRRDLTEQRRLLRSIPQTIQRRECVIYLFGAYSHTDDARLAQMWVVLRGTSRDSAPAAEYKLWTNFSRFRCVANRVSTYIPRLSNEHSVRQPAVICDASDMGRTAAE